MNRKIVIALAVMVLPVAGMLFAGVIGTQKGVPQASISLKDTNMALGHCNRADWTLEKTTSTPEIADMGTAEWTVTAVKASISDNYVHVFGYVSVYNGGGAPATIGNILVNMQTQRMVGDKKKWVSASADVANASNGDAATTVNVLAAASQENPTWNAQYNSPPTCLISGDKGVFKENAASGKLEFTDADSNTVWSITPQQAIQAGGTVNLRFEAEFNNAMMKIPVGADVRAEVIVTFGNAGGRSDSGASGAKIDINGNGLIDTDEAYIRSVPSRISMTVPALVTCNDAVALTDPETVADGTVTMENFNNGGIDDGVVIGAGDPAGTSYVYTVTVDVTANEQGGYVYNTAYLDGDDIYVPVQTGQNPVYDEFGNLTGYAPVYYYALCCEGTQLEASRAVLVRRNTQEPQSGRLQPGDFRTFDQGGWQNMSPIQGYEILITYWSNIYPSGRVSVGDYYKMTFTSPASIRAYLPANGNESVLTANLTNPTSTSANKFGGHVLALRLNVDSSAAAILPMPVGFGNLLLADFVAGSNIGLNLTTEQAAALNGQTISQVLADEEHVLGGNGATSAYGLDVSQLNLLAERLNDSCKFSSVSPFADLHLRKP